MERIRVAAAIVRKRKPSCGFILLDGLEAMDTQELSTLAAWLEAENLQAIATRVSTGSECTIIIEDGLVAGAVAGSEEKDRESGNGMVKESIMQIETGKKQSKVRAVIYGPEGIGKSTLAATFPRPLFVDVEGGTHHLDIARISAPKSWSAICQIVTDVAAGRLGPEYQTLVIDTADWAEKGPQGSHLP